MSMRIFLYKLKNDDMMYIDDLGCDYLGGFDVLMMDIIGGLD